MNPTSQNPDSKFPFSSGPAMDNRTLYLTVAASAIFAFVFTLLFSYSVLGTNKLGYGLLVSIPPALGALLVVKLTRVFDSWRGAVIVYFALFVLTIIMQAVGRKIPV